MPKILLVANTDWYIYNFRLALAQQLKDSGYDVRIVTPPGKFAAQFGELGLAWTPWRLARTTISFWAELRSFFHILGIYNRYRPDIVHHHTIKAVLYGSLAAKLLRVGAVVNSIAGLGYVFSEADEQARRIRQRIDRWYRLANQGQNCRVVFENRADWAYFLAAGYVSPGRACLIESIGVDPVKFQPLPPPAAGPLTVLYAGRMLWDKGVGVFVEAARQFGADSNLKFVLVGEPDPGNPSSIEATTLQGWQAEGRVIWQGWQADMSRVYARSHIVVLPTMYGEGVPTTLIEAAACGRPIIATDTPGCRAIVQNQVNGVLVAPNRPDQLADAIRSLAADPLKRQQMGRRGREIFLEKFTSDKINAAMLQVYAGLLSE